MKRIHIVGLSPRTGTTLMLEIMRHCFAIDACSRHEDRLSARHPGAPAVFLTKAPGDIMILRPSLVVDPDLYAICMIRDPRDVICSKHDMDPDRYWAGLNFWKKYLRAYDKLEGHPRFISVKYEQLVSDPESIEHELCQRLPFLELRKPFAGYHQDASVSPKSEQALRGVRPISATSIGVWRQHKDRVLGQIERHGSITDDLIRFGYEDDDAWLLELEGISPDLGRGHFAETVNFTRRWKRGLRKYSEAMKRILEQRLGRRMVTRRSKQHP